MTLRRGLASTGLLMLLASLLVGQFMATTHEFTARHATCPRHGEVIDVDSRSSAAESADTFPQISTPNPESSQSQHQHCLFVSSRGSQKSFRIVGPVASSQSTASQWASATAADALHPSLALYLTAPKHSPPTV